MGARLSGLLRRPFRLIHIVWATLVVAVCIALVAMGGGHPPPMIFVPPVLLAGVLGHLLLLGVAWLAGRARARVEAALGHAVAWPIELTLVAVALAAVTAIAAAGATGAITQFRTRPLEWLAIAAIAFAHGVTFFLLLLRRPVARWLLAAVSAGWVVALAFLLHEARPWELPIAFALIAGLAGLAVYFLRSARVRSAFG